MGKKVTIEFHAFIPNFLGKAFSAYPHQTGLKNQAAFDAAVKAIPGTWLPEPGDITYRNWYFETDERGFGGGSHRVGFQGTIDTANIGALSGTVFRHGCFPSHRVRTKDTGYFTSSGETGSIDGPYAKTATASSKETIKNSTAMSIIETSGSAAYPFITSPDIDYTTRFTLIKAGSGGAANLVAAGVHDSFPFYEILVNGKSLYTYSAKDPGPSITNLNTPTAFAGATPI